MGEMHILGYLIDYKNKQFQEALILFRKARQKRAQQIYEKLLKLGVLLDKEALYEIAGEGSIGRLHFAKALMKEGFVRNIVDAFQKYLGYGKPAFVPKFRLKPEAAIKMIRRIGGIPVMAHPFYGHYTNKALIKGLIKNGLCGIEVWHSKHSPSTSKMFGELAKELGLLSTGGSDCHGTFENEDAHMGSVKVPYSVLENLRERKEEIDLQSRKIFET
jgi:3',5'-nucleoside bisphosphate phosphatase